jgi:uncharacterized protein YkwD
VPAAALLAALVAALIAAGLIGAPGARANHYDYLLDAADCPKQYDPTATLREQKRAMRCLHQAARKQAGVPAVTRQQQLWDAAQAKARDIFNCQRAGYPRQQFSHTACGHYRWYWPDFFGYTQDVCWALGENIAWGSGRNGSARAIMSAWLHSDPHRTTILRWRYHDIGVGLKRGIFKGTPHSQVWVVILGRQSPPPCS